MVENKDKKPGGESGGAGSVESDPGLLEKLEEMLGRIEEKLDRLDLHPPRSIGTRHREVSPFWGLILIVIGLYWMDKSWTLVHDVIPPVLFGLGILLLLIYYLRK
jgi:hypothetical protein